MIPEVYLINSTIDPVLKIYQAYHVTHRKMPFPFTWEAFDKEGFSRERIYQEVRELFNQAHQGAFEFVDFTFLIKNVSRAFTHQIVRCRHASYSQQSQRTVDMGKFYTNSYLRLPPKIAAREVLKRTFENSMKQSERTYRRLIDDGASVEDARGVLPTNVGTTIMWHINYRSLRDTLKVRLCLEAQDENRDVMEKIKWLVTEYEPLLGEKLQKICEIDGQCHSNWTKCNLYPWKKSEDKESIKNKYEKEIK